MLPSCVKLDQSPSTSQHHRLRSTPTLLSQTAVEKAGIPYASPSSSISPENHNMERKPGMVGKDIEAHESESSARMDTRKKSQDAKLTDAIFEAPESSHIGAGHGQKLSSSQMQSWPIARSREDNARYSISQSVEQAPALFDEAYLRGFSHHVLALCRAILIFFWQMWSWFFSTIGPVVCIFMVLVVFFLISTEVLWSSIVARLGSLWDNSWFLVSFLATASRSITTAVQPLVCHFPVFENLCPDPYNTFESYGSHITATVSALSDNHDEIHTTSHLLRTFTAILSSIYVAIPPSDNDFLDKFLQDSHDLQELFDAYASKNVLLLDDINFKSSFLISALQTLLNSPSHFYGGWAMGLIGYPNQYASSRDSLTKTLQSWSDGVDDLSRKAEIITRQWYAYQKALSQLSFDMKTRRERQALGWWLDFSGFPVTLSQKATLGDFRAYAKSVETIQRTSPPFIRNVSINLSLAKSNIVDAKARMPQARLHLTFAWEKKSQVFVILLADLRNSVAKTQLSQQERDLSNNENARFLRIPQTTQGYKA